MYISKGFLFVSTKEILLDKIPFIETLSHNMILDQLPALKQRRRFEIEKILSIFDSRAGIYLEIDEKEYPLKYKSFLERLHTVMKQPEVVKDLMYEEMLNQEMQQNHDKYLQAQENIKVMERKILEAETREEEALKKANEAKTREELVLIKSKTAIAKLKASGMSISEIATIFTLSAEEVEKILS